MPGYDDGKPPPTSTMSTVTDASTIASRTLLMASANAAGVMAWLPTWKQMPSASAAWRAANSRMLMSRGSASYLEERRSLAWSELTLMRSRRLRSLDWTPLSEDALTTLPSSDINYRIHVI